MLNKVFFKANFKCSYQFRLIKPDRRCKIQTDLLESLLMVKTYKLNLDDNLVFKTVRLIHLNIKSNLVENQKGYRKRKTAEIISHQSIQDLLQKSDIFVKDNENIENKEKITEIETSKKGY